MFRITLVLLIMLINSGTALACICLPISVVDNFQQSSFVATAKILKVTRDAENPDYHHAELELLTLYKGKKLKTIKISSVLNSSCAFLPEVNSSWLIFASEWKGVLSFGMCSGSEQLDRKFDSVRYPEAAYNYGRSIKLKLQALKFLKDRNLSDPNPSHLYAFNTELHSIKGFENKNRFAVFQVDVNKDLSVNGIKVLQKFKSRALNKAVLKSMKTKLKLIISKGGSISVPTRLIILCYYYGKEGSDESFVSLLEL